MAEFKEIIRILARVSPLRMFGLAFAGLNGRSFGSLTRFRSIATIQLPYADWCMSTCQSRPMNVTYFKRYRMEIELDAVAPQPPLQGFFHWIAWHDALLDHHA